MLYYIMRLLLNEHCIFLAYSELKYENETSFTCELFEKFAAEFRFANYLTGF